MPLSSNTFAKNEPTKSSHTFANNDPTPSTHTFSDSTPNKGNYNLFSGDNTSAGTYGGDFDAFGQIYGQGQYGGLAHFLGRNPGIPSH